MTDTAAPRHERAPAPRRARAPGRGVGRRVGRGVGRGAALVVAGLLVLTAASVAGCHGKDPPPGKRVMGTDGRERYLIRFDSKEPDLSEYRDRLKQPGDEADAYVDRMRSKLKDAHADVEGQVSALGGRVVEVWWMSNAITVEIDPKKADSLLAMVGKLGVKSVTPDQPLAE